MTEGLNGSLAGSLLLVGLLGFRHGFDADHIAAVNGMTRARQLQGFWTSRLVGAQFALGHSSVILLASLLLHGQSVALPQWLDGLGMVISTCFLLAIAATNLVHAVRPTSDERARPVGSLVAALMRLSGRQLHPALVGMAFAFSFDSMAQAAFFASRGSQFSGMGAVVLLAISFGLGMMVADAANGALLNWFASQSDRLARQASRFSSGFIALIALATVSAGFLREFHESFASTWEALGIWIGVGLMALTSIVFSVLILLQKARKNAAVSGR